jgi:tetratricopeptide (TPR) repeat protein
MSFPTSCQRTGFIAVLHTSDFTRNADAWHELGSALVEAGDRARACAALRHALRIDPWRARTLRALGNLLFDSGQFENALEYFERFSRARFKD